MRIVGLALIWAGVIGLLKGLGFIEVVSWSIVWPVILIVLGTAIKRGGYPFAWKKGCAGSCKGGTCEMCGEGTCGTCEGGACTGECKGHVCEGPECGECKK